MFRINGCPSFHKISNKMVQPNGGVSTPNILARKSEEGPLPYYKTRAKLEGNNQLGPLLEQSGVHYLSILVRKSKYQ
jgi:hypothetical protein